MFIKIQVYCSLWASDSVGPATRLHSSDFVQSSCILLLHAEVHDIFQKPIHFMGDSILFVSFLFAIFIPVPDAS